ncbi:MAG TPA: hypothetical protein PLO33_04400 [Kouleothrix sp.]|uniref:hypothetical protein n=1 Tax=Kouleothrix sp. TaxID=2779161 RepID=UPI002B586DBD|nr:hypothetical protein [Kouleothrix sp.]HRC74894.1 hypothetical protein [Kouleothrix sp.]
MSYRQERYRRRRGNGCLLALVILVWGLLIAGLLYYFLLRPQVSRFLGSQIGDELRGNPNGQLEQTAVQGAASTLPTAIAALPSGELHISEGQANDFLAARAGQLKPLDSVTVRFVPGQVQADLKALGTTSTAKLGLAVQNGRIIAVDPQLDGPLGRVVSLPSLTGALERQLNDQLALQGRRITDVRVDQGEIVITTE